MSLPIGEDGVDQRAAAPAVSSEHPSAICHGELDMARQGAARCACDADGCLDGGPGDHKLTLYVDQLVTEMTVKAGLKYSAVRRSFVPATMVDDVIAITAAALDAGIVG